MTTPILGIREIAGNQQNQYITANEAFRALEAAGNDFLGVDLAAGNASLTEAQFTAFYAFIAGGHNVARVLTVPASKRAFVVINAGLANVTVTRGSSTVVVPSDASALLLTDGTADGLVGIGGGGGGVGWGSITGNIDEQTDLNTILTNIGIALSATGILATNDTILLEALSDTTLRIHPLAKGLFYDQIPLVGMNDAVKSFPQIDVALATVPIASDGLYIFYVSLDSSGAVYFTQGDAGTNNNRLRIGVAFIKRVAGVNSFWDGAAGPRNVLTFPEMAANSAMVKIYLTLASDVSVLPNANLTVKNTGGTLKGESIGWGTATPNQRAIAANAVTSFVTLNPSITSQTAFPAAGTAVQTTQYWNGSAMVSTGNAQSASVQRFLMTSTGGIILQVGEATYTTLQSAVDNAQIAPFSALFPELTHFTEIARIAVRNGAANLQLATDAIFVAKGGGTNGGGASLGTMAVQNANAVAVTGGTINNTTIGLTTPAQIQATNIGAGIAPDPAYSIKTSGNVLVNTPSGQANIYLAQAGTVNGRIYAGGGAGTDVVLEAQRFAQLSGVTAAQMVHNTAVKLTTTNTGVDVTGRVNSTTGATFGNTAQSGANILDWYERGDGGPPSAVGSTTAGAPAAYTVRRSKFKRDGDRVTGSISLAWNGHTGTGNLSISPLPYAAHALDGDCAVSVYVNGLVVGAGQQLQAFISGTSINLARNETATGAHSLQPIQANLTYITLTFSYKVA